jgi:hypothetical protein
LAPESTCGDCSAKLPASVFAFFTTPTNRPFRAIAAPLMRRFKARFVDSEPIRQIPNLERIEIHDFGMTTLAVFRAPAPGTSRRRAGAG